MKWLWLVMLLASLLMMACGSDALPGNSVLSGAGESCTKTADCEPGLKCIALVCIADIAPDIGTNLGIDAVQADTVNDVTNDLPVDEVDANGDVAGVDACQPSCEGKNCGDDGCGGSCGDCGGTGFCDDGTCKDGCVSDEGCTEPGLSTCLDEMNHHACEQVMSGCYQWGETKNCEEGFVCANGGCISPAECGDAKPVVEGIVKNSVADMDFTGEEVSIQLFHKLDIDEWEDGCISKYTMEFSKLGLGCKFHLEMNTSPDAVFNVTSAILEADSFCPGWSDADEGEYVLESSSLSMCSTVEVADYMTESACVPEVVVGFGGILNLVRKTDGKELDVDLSGMTVKGDMVSSGDTELVCPEPCALKECGSDGCGGSCGTCGCGEECQEGQCDFKACDGKQCGDDGCGGSCGTCSCGESCVEGLCLFENCGEKNCGDDGCGGSCGVCGEGGLCELGKCQYSPHWTDPSSGLMWQNPPAEDGLEWAEAKEYCKFLVLSNKVDWRLPTVGELRTLIRGCPATEAGGSCNIEEGDCLAKSCQDDSCYGCSHGDGPGDEGCYWPAEIQGPCALYWSSLVTEESDDSAWSVYFIEGYVANFYLFNDTQVRCVR
jgi:hypothetical protein